MSNDHVYAIYTDGACKKNPGKGGWAYAIVKNNTVVKRGCAYVAHTTNNRMELTAVLEAFKYLETSQAFDAGITYHIFVDSKYVYDGVTSWMEQWKKKGWKTATNKDVLNLDLWVELDQFSAKYKNNVEWNWVKAHNGNQFNELVDELASNAASHGVTLE